VEPVVRARRVTIVDVARHARVSTTTVSKVLRNAYGASPAMRVKVQQAIDELGYRPSTAARGMRGRTYTVGVMLPDIRNPFFADILDGFTERLHDSEYQVLHGHGCNSEGPEARVTEAMIDHGMDGLVLIAPVSPRSHLEHVARTVPTVVVGRHGHSPAYDTVTDDDHAGAHLVVAHLAGLGHRRIAHIEHHETDATRLAEMPNAIRANGYRDAMRAHGLAAEIDIVSTTYTQEGGYLGAKQILARCGSRKYALHGPNRTYAPVRLRDGSSAIEFLRANPHSGGVSCGDRGDRIHEVLSDSFLERLVERRGTCILYTHLGKLDRGADKRRFSPAVVAAFRLLGDYYRSGKLLVTTTSRLLDLSQNHAVGRTF